MSLVSNFTKSVDNLLKGRKAAPEGSISKDGKRIKRGGKWVPKGRSKSASGSANQEELRQAYRNLSSAIKAIQPKLKDKAIQFKPSRDGSLEVSYRGASKTISAVGKEAAAVRKDMLNAVLSVVKESQAAPKKAGKQRAELPNSPHWDKVPPNAVEAAEWAIPQLKNKKFGGITLMPTSGGHLKLTRKGKSKTVRTDGIYRVLDFKRELNAAVADLMGK